MFANGSVAAVKRYVGAVTAMLMWAAGTGLVLITLSGETLEKAMYISLAALTVNLVAIALGDGVEE